MMTRDPLQVLNMQTVLEDGKVVNKMEVRSLLNDECGLNRCKKRVPCQVMTEFDFELINQACPPSGILQRMSNNRR